jgi:hypothetical protein
MERINRRGGDGVERKQTSLYNPLIVFMIRRRLPDFGCEFKEADSLIVTL